MNSLSRRGSILFFVTHLLLCSGCPTTTNSDDGELSVPSDASSATADMSGCRSSSQCKSDSAPVCMAGACVACTSSAEAECAVHSAATPRCDDMSGRCVACHIATAATDCSRDAPICDANACRICRAHAECPSLVCDPIGSCAAIGDVVYVDVTSCAGGKPDGSRASPFCQISDATAAIKGGPLGGKSIVHVAGGGIAMPYGPVIVDQSLTLIGPGRAAASTAVLHQGRGTAVTVNGAGKQLILDGFEITGSDTGVSCTDASAIVLRSNFHDVAFTAVSAANCKLTVDGTVILSNGSGINVAGGTYAITNDFIVDNGSFGRAVELDNASSGVFALNTLTENQYTFMQAAAVSCGTGQPKLISTSIVWRNGQSGAKSQFAGNCTLQAVVTGADSYAGAITKDPVFVSPGLPNLDYHLKQAAPANATCCVDKTAMGGVTWPPHDVDGNHRPLGAGWDVGAQELQ